MLQNAGYATKVESGSWLHSRRSLTFNPMEVGPMDKRDLITQEFLRETLDYNPDTGIFKWKARSDCDVQWNSRYAGTPAGWNDPNGYQIITINYENYRAHHLAWLWVYGAWPERQIDHINRARKDNRIVNLRNATRSENAANSRIRSDNTSGCRGISWDSSRDKWCVYVNRDGVRRHLGRFTSLEEAKDVHRKAFNALFGEFSMLEDG